MFDLIHRNILSASALRSKRREHELWRLEKHQRDSIKGTETGTGTGTGTIEEINDAQALINFIDAFLIANEKRSKNKSSKSDDTTTNPTTNPAATATPSIVGLTREHVFLSIHKKQIIQAPLMVFVDILANLFKQKMTSTALCFVADASSSLGLDVIHQIVNDSHAGMVRARSSTVTGVTVTGVTVTITVTITVS